MTNNNKKNILFVTSSLLVIYELVCKFSIEYNVHVLYIIDDVKLIKSNDNLHFHKIRTKSNLFSLSELGILEIISFTPFFIIFWYKLIKISLENDISLINAHWVIPSGFFTWLSSLFINIFKKNIPFIVTLRGSDVKIYGNNSVIRSVSKLILSKSDWIISVSEDLKNSVVTWGILPQKISVIPRGVNLKHFYPFQRNESLASTHKLDQNDHVVTYVGNLIALKQVDLILKVIQSINIDYNLKLLIIGDGPEMPNLKTLVNQLKMDNVIFVGRVNQNEIPHYLSLTDTLLLFSKSEGLPGCIQEAFACGVPVLARDVGGVSKLVFNDINGYLVKDSMELKNKIISLMNPKVKRQLGDGALRYAQEKLSLEKVYFKTRCIFEQILSKTN